VAHGPPITGFSHVDLSVRDREASARWYVDVLGFEVSGEGRNETFGFRSTVLVHPSAPLSIALVEHRGNPGEPFDERRCGLDHLSFELPAGFDLEGWARDLAERGYEAPDVGDDDGIALVVLRDPDNIQIELYAGRLTELDASS
jgi:catechol 2,3-dioxygenase-like lactoylglutathione lyase family enzyme